MAHQRFDALLHFARSLVGKRQRHYAVGRYAQVEQMNYFVGEHTRFARPCACYHKRWAVAVEHGFALWLIQLA